MYRRRVITPNNRDMSAISSRSADGLRGKRNNTLRYGAAVIATSTLGYRLS